MLAVLWVTEIWNWVLVGYKIKDTSHREYMAMLFIRHYDSYHLTVFALFSFWKESSVAHLLFLGKVNASTVR
jgi:hypothetical protein